MSDDIEQRPEAVAKKSIKDAMLGGEYLWLQFSSLGL